MPHRWTCPAPQMKGQIPPIGVCPSVRLIVGVGLKITLPPRPPTGGPLRHPQVELCIIHHDEEIAAKQHAPELVLVAVVGGTRPFVTITEFRAWLTSCFNILGDSVTIRRFHLEDFVIVFSFYDDMLRVLHDRPPAWAPFMLMFKHWHRQAMTSAEKLFYRVTLRLQGILAHVWSLATACKLLSPACSNVRLTPATLAKMDLGRMTVVAWCIHQDLIPVEKILFVPEPDVVILRGPPLFVDPKEVIFHNQPTL
jgi:hypothetical protein